MPTTENASTAHVSAYPLDWPEQYSRTEARKRKYWKGNLSLKEARDSLLEELRTSGATSIVLSTNIETYVRGGQEIPYANQGVPDDPAVAVYFQKQGEQFVFACDRWKKPEGNMRAIAITVRDLRRIDKRGVSDFASRAYQGFKRLPETTTGTDGNPWWEVPGVEPDTALSDLRSAYKRKVQQVHPDRGGSTEAFHRVQRAYEQARAALT